MTSQSTRPTVQLLAYRFDAGAAFEGRLVGALERIESGGTLRVREVLFVGRDPDSGELVAFAEKGRQQGGLVASLLGFRLDAAQRGPATQRALRAYDRGDEQHPLRSLGDTLAPGAAVVAVLVEHTWVDAIGDAVERTGGAPLVNVFGAGTDLAEHCSALLAAAAAPAPRP
jgi:hypothetical protein